MEKNDERTVIGMDFEPEAVILADGDFPTHSIAQRLLRDAAKVVCCDGAADKYIMGGVIPYAIIGDGDSLSSETRAKYADIIHSSADQETNDLTKAVTFLMENGCRRIAVLGATGKREDHTLGNISLLMEYMKAGVEVRMVTNFGTFIPVMGNCMFESFNRQQVSVFNFGAVNMRSEGLQYPLRDFTNWWQGTLNQCEGNSFAIYAEGEYMVYMTHEAKPEKRD